MLRTLAFLAVFCLLPAVAFAIIVDPDELIGKRGDANMDDVVDGSDPIFINNWLYSGGPEPECLNQADANNDGIVDGSDAIYLFAWLYNGGPPPPTPGPFNDDCTSDDEPFPGCDVDPCS